MIYGTSAGVLSALAIVGAVLPGLQDGFCLGA